MQWGWEASKSEMLREGPADRDEVRGRWGEKGSGPRAVPSCPRGDEWGHNEVSALLCLCFWPENNRSLGTAVRHTQSCQGEHTHSEVWMIQTHKGLLQSLHCKAHIYSDDPYRPPYLHHSHTNIHFYLDSVSVSPPGPGQAGVWVL